jgi:hypothetical protein
MLEDIVSAGGAVGGGYLAVKAGQGLLKRKLDRDAKYDGMSSDLDYQSNVREANAIQDPSERNATLTKLRRDYDDRKWELQTRKKVGDVGGKVALGGLGAVGGYGLGKYIVGSTGDNDMTSALKNAALGGLSRQESIFSKADFANPIHGLLAKTGAAAGALSGYQDADKRYWEGRKEIEYISDPEERANRLRDYDSLNSKLGRAGNTLKTSAIRAGIGAGIGYVGSKTAGHVFGDRPQPQVQPIKTTNMNKKIRKAANFALPNLNLSPNVNLGAKIGAGLGLASGLGIGESDRERENTDLGGRLGKIVGKTAIGGGLGAGAGAGYNKFKGIPNSNSVNTAKLSKDADEIFKTQTPVASPVPTPDKSAQQARMDAQSQKWRDYENRPQPQPQPQKENKFKQAYNFLNRDIADPELQRDLYRGYVSTRRKLGLYNKTMRKSANFQDPATIQRLIQKGSTYIPQDNTGVVSLEATLKGKMKKKPREPKVPASMGVKEINSMIESGKPTGKYFSKSVRKSAVFQQRDLKTAEFIRQQGFLEQAGRYISEPIGNSLRNAASNARGGAVGGAVNGLLSKVPYFFQGAKAKSAKGAALQGVGDYLHTKEGAERAAIGTGLLAGGGLLAAGALASRKPKVLEETQYNKTIRKAANFAYISPEEAQAIDRDKTRPASKLANYDVLKGRYMTREEVEAKNKRRKMQALGLVGAGAGTALLDRYAFDINGDPSLDTLGRNIGGGIRNILPPQRYELGLAPWE